MKLYIGDHIKAGTTRCHKGFSCINKDGEGLCKVISCIDDDVHFILCDNVDPCSYQKIQGERIFCSCPTRKEIYNKYKI